MLEVINTISIKDRIANSFSRKSYEYSDRAGMQATIACNLSEIIKAKYYVGLDVMALDVGCGTGYIAENFLGLMNFMQTDISPQMCEIASQFGAVTKCDMNELPFKDESFDMVTSSMAFQWSENLVRTIEEAKRVLQPSGIFAFTIPNSKSLVDLKSVFKALEKPNSINDFHDEEYILRLLELSKFTTLESYNSEIKIEFDSVYSMLKSFKDIGANVSQKGGEKLTKSDLKFIEENYPKVDNKKVLTWNVNYFICKK